MDSTALKEHFSEFRKNIIGIDQEFETPRGRKKIIYADWIASGRLYRPIEHRLTRAIAPFVGNTHTESTVTGGTMTNAYHEAMRVIKEHVGAADCDVLISSNSGMTGVVNKFQRILGLKVHEKYHNQLEIPKEERPVVFCSHMEHHSNQTSWLETVVDLEIIQPDDNGMMDLNNLKKLLDQYADRRVKIAAITSCSNVTGIFTPYYDVARMMHQHGGYCFVDFAASAPYIDIDMHPEDEEAYLDAIYFSPHKFLGGPGSSGALLFNSKLYKNRVPDNPGGGTVDWTNPWGEHKYIDEIEAREDGGTPAFLQTIKTALCIKLKNEMGTQNMQRREEELMAILWEGISNIPNVHILAPNERRRLGVFSLYIDDLHYNLATRILNDRYGIQARGGCSCAGTYGHYLLHVTPEHSHSITSLINHGDHSQKPGWLRISVHPTMTDDEVHLIVKAIQEISSNFQEWGKAYIYNKHTNEFRHEQESDSEHNRATAWLETPLTSIEVNSGKV